MKVTYIKNSLVFLVTFLVSAFCLKLLIPKKDVPASIYSYSAKFSHFMENKDEYEVIFVGTSRVHNQISPETFDQHLKEAGYDYQSFNFGLQGARILTTRSMLNEILAARPANLKWVFIENLLDAGYSPLQNARTPREIHFHSFNDTRSSISYILNSGDSFPAKVALSLSHLPPFFFNYINLGRVVDQFQTKSVAELAEELGEDQDGYSISPRKEIVEEVYLNKVDQLKAKPYIETPLTPNRVAIVEEITDVVEAAGAEPLFLVAPGIIRNDEMIAAQKEGYIQTLFVYNDPGRYPDLYAIENRSDEEHLNEQGSELFSTLIAEDFVRYLDRDACLEHPLETDGSACQPNSTP